MGIQADSDEHPDRDRILDEAVPMNWRECLKTGVIGFVGYRGAAA